MSHFDDFFRANYRGMVGYCMAFGYSEADVEEEVADVILRHYEDYRERITGPSPDTTMRHWMNRRVLLNLKSRYKRYEYTKTDALDPATLGEQLTFDDPQSIVDLKQRLPHVPPILIRYEPYAGNESAHGANSNTDKSYFCRERKKFLTALTAR